MSLVHKQSSHRVRVLVWLEAGSLPRDFLVGFWGWKARGETAEELLLQGVEESISLLHPQLD